MIQSGGKYGWQDYASILTPIGKGLKLGMELELGIQGKHGIEGSHGVAPAIIAEMEKDKTLSEFGLTKNESPGIEYCTRPASLEVHEQVWPSILKVLSELPVLIGDGVGGHIHAPKHASADECNKVGYLFNRHDTRHIVEALTREPGYGGYEHAHTVNNRARLLSMDTIGYQSPKNLHDYSTPRSNQQKPLLERGRIIGGRGHGQPVVLGNYDTYEFRCFPASLVFEEIMAFLEMTDMAWHFAPSRDWHELNLFDVIPQVTADGSYPYMKAHFQKKVLDAKLEKVDPRLTADDRQAALGATA